MMIVCIFILCVALLILMYSIFIQAIAEGGATGPTFRPEGMNNGFAVITIAGRKQDGVVDILAQRLCLSTNADRQLNMRLFADASAELFLEAMSISRSIIRNKETNTTTATSTK